MMYAKKIALSATRTTTRKSVLVLLTFILAAWISLMTTWRIESDSSRVLTDGELMIRLAVLPAFISAFVLLLTTACARLPAKPDASAVSAAQIQSGPFQAQVVGLQWMNPLQRKDYPTEWQLLWTLGLVKPNVDDDMVKKNPKCLVPCDHIPRRSWPLFRAKAMLNELIAGFSNPGISKHQEQFAA